MGAENCCFLVENYCSRSRQSGEEGEGGTRRMVDDPTRVFCPMHVLEFSVLLTHCGTQTCKQTCTRDKGAYLFI